MTSGDFVFVLSALAAMQAPLDGAIAFQSITPSFTAPQPLGTPVTWTVTATDSNPGPLTFQFNVVSPGGATSMVFDYNVGAYNAGVWSAQFVWATIAGEGTYQVQIVAKDFNSGEAQTQTASYQLFSRVSGTTAVVSATANPLVALFSAPACPLGSSMQVMFQESGSTVWNSTDWKACTDNTSMNFYVAGMYPGSTYLMLYRVQTGAKFALGREASFTTGPLPSNITFPVFTVKTPGKQFLDTRQPIVLHSIESTTDLAHFPVATDLAGKILWYFRPLASAVLTRPLPDETMLALQDGRAWGPSQFQQLILEYDLAGNVVHQSNIGAIQQQLLTLGAVDGGSCEAVPNPAPIGAACVSFFNHDLIRLPNGYTALIATTEKIFPAGTQGSTSPLPIDIEGDMIVVLDTNWQAVWYWDSFDPAGGGYGYPNLPVSRAATLGETCAPGGSLCGPVLLTGLGTAPTENQWLHGNSLFYMPSSGDFLFSMRSQDWLVKIDYNNGAGTGNVLWRMGNGGDFTFNNTNNDAWPWFSGQHDAEYANNGAGPLTVFDDGNTRLAAPPAGLGAGCQPSECSSRGMALTADETNLTVTPVMSQYLGESSLAYGSAQLLSNGNYFFDAGLVGNYSFGLEVLPTAGAIGGTEIYSVQTRVDYRAFRLSSLYQPLWDVAANLSKASGDGQSTPAGRAFSAPLQVTVTDANGIAVPGIGVTFTVTPAHGGASGTFSTSPAMPVLTDANGNATAPALAANAVGGTFTVTATVNALNATFTLTNLTFSLASSSAIVGSAAGSGSVLLLSNGAWTAVSNSSWLQLSPGSLSGSGNALIQFSYSANPNAIAQIGTLTIAGLMFTVTQAGTSYAPATLQTTLVSSGLNNPEGVAVDGSRNVYIADTGNQAIKEWSAGAQQVSTLVSSGLDFPAGVAVDSQGNVYVADEKNKAIETWAVSTGTVTSLVSTGIGSPVGVAVDRQGNVYFSDAGYKTIDEWDAATQQVIKLDTGLSLPTGVAVDAEGNVYFADQKNNAINEWSAATKQVIPLVSGLNAPFGVAVDGEGNVYFADTGNKAIKEWSPATGQVTVVASTGLKSPYGVAVDGQGNIYVADLGSTIQRYTAVYVALNTTSLSEGAQAGSDSVTAQVLPAGAALTATSNKSWLTITGTSDGIISFSFLANTSQSSRSAQVTIAGQTVTVTQSASVPNALLNAPARI
jgi:sugar lactone lactonase YvrE